MRSRTYIHIWQAYIQKYTPTKPDMHALSRKGGRSLLSVVYSTPEEPMRLKVSSVPERMDPDSYWLSETNHTQGCDSANSQISGTNAPAPSSYMVLLGVPVCMYVCIVPCALRPCLASLTTCMIYEPGGDLTLLTKSTLLSILLENVSLRS